LIRIKKSRPQPHSLAQIAAGTAAGIAAPFEGPTIVMTGRSDSNWTQVQ